MTDNFNIIYNRLFRYSSLEKMNNDSKYLSIQVIKRRKDPGNESMQTGSYIIKTYIIRDKKELEKYESEIKTLCEVFNARAYISVVWRTFEDTSLNLLNKISAKLKENRNLKGFDWMKNSLSSINSTKPMSNKFIIDIDECSDINVVTKLIKIINNCRNNSRFKQSCKLSIPDNIFSNELFIKYTGDDKDYVFDNVLFVVPTRSGYHIIAHRFDRISFDDACMKEFGMKFEIKENHITLLYESTKY